MRKPFSLTISVALACIFAATVQASAPDGYYSGITGLKDSALKTKLYEIVSQHNTNDYSGLFLQSFCYTDVKDDADGEIWWDMYSDTKRYVSRGWSGMNREHSFPKSWWGGSTSLPAYTDLNHLYPSDGDANMAKSNYPLGEVDPDHVTFSNGVVLVGNPVSGQGGGAKYVFEPADEYKGDFARTYFYMVTCYQDQTWKYTYMPQNGAYPSLQGWAIDLLLKWHRADPVSDKETKRNDEVYKLQYNRNPYIDYPNLVEYIWGTMVGQEFSDTELPPIGEGTLLAPVNGSTVDFGDVVVGNTSTITVAIRGSLSADLSLRIIGDTDKSFSIPVSSIDWKTVNESGYELNVSYSPKSVGESTAQLLLYDGGLQEITSYVITLTGTAHETPTFDQIVATEATNVTAESFRANWQRPANPETIDYYTVNITEYANGNTQTTSIDTDDTETYLDYTGTAGSTYSYTVQSVRFGMKSELSNTIFVDYSGIASASSIRPLSISNISGGIRFTCETTHTNVRIHDMSGRTVCTIPTVENGHCELLPFGAYLVSSEQCPRPVKVLVTD